APSETSILYRASRLPRCGRRASPRSAWRWRAQGPCRPWPWCWSCRPDGTARRSDPVGRVVFRVSHRHGETAVPRARGDAHLAGVSELDGVANEIEQHLREALLITQANWERLLH